MKRMFLFLLAILLFGVCAAYAEGYVQIDQETVKEMMARGNMVRYLAEIQADAPEQIKGFSISSYHFYAERSNNTQYVFVRTEIPGKISV
ncbi:MAG: hypothetical protein IJ157_09360 [Clostridia bacterium]|nr:hypothetical protein [Clostridia bacterium]